MHRLSRTVLYLAACCSVSLAAFARAERPNIVWITAEDLSPALGCYGDEYATTPHLDAFAKRSLRFTHAFATSPVCSTARNCLITGCYPTSMGTHAMRSAFPLPEGVVGVPQLLRSQGYFTTNNVKTDYNTSDADRLIEACWDDCSETAHWRLRPDKSQPFFSVFNLMDSHQSRSMVWPTDKFKAEVQSQLEAGEIHDASIAPLPPYYPDTPIVRREWARFYDCVTAVDKQVGALLSQLRQDGLQENTIVFFLGDHGSGMPRHKRALLDSGMRVPLIIHVPSRFDTLVSRPPHGVSDQLVSFIDFPPTLLALSGLNAPEYMQGRAFMGQPQGQNQVVGEKRGIDARDYVFGHRDRVDEAFDTARSVRSRKFLYIRNFMPHLGYNQPTAWPDQGELRHEFYRMANSAGLTRAQRHFLGPTRPIEELYDCENDPHNQINLAASAKHFATLAEMRRALSGHIQSTVDQGFVTETQRWNALESGRRLRKVDFVRAYAAADRAGHATEAQLIEMLKQGNQTTRYWAAMGLAGHSTISDATREEMTEALQDASPSVRIAIAGRLAKDGDSNAIQILGAELERQDLNVNLEAMRTVELLGEHAKQLEDSVEQTLRRLESLMPSPAAATFKVTREQDLAMFISFSGNAFLKRSQP